MAKLLENLKVRIARIKENNKVTDKVLHITIEGYVPILITLPTVIQRYAVGNTVNSIKDNSAILVSHDGTDRFTHIGSAQSPLTLNILDFYYDSLFKDIIIVPDLRYYSLIRDNTYTDIRGYGIGGDSDITSSTISQKLPVDDTLSIDLPVPSNINSTLKTKILSMPGIRPSNLITINKLEESINNGQINHGDRTLAPFIELGTLSNIFGNKLNRLPTYLLYQHTHTEFGIKKLGNINTGNNLLYLFIRF